MTVAQFGEDMLQILVEKVVVTRETMIELQGRLQTIADKVTNHSFKSNQQVNEIRNQLTKLQNMLQRIPVQQPVRDHRDIKIPTNLSNHAI